MNEERSRRWNNVRLFPFPSSLILSLSSSSSFFFGVFFGFFLFHFIQDGDMETMAWGCESVSEIWLVVLMGAAILDQHPNSWDDFADSNGAMTGGDENRSDGVQGRVQDLLATLLDPLYATRLARRCHTGWGIFPGSTTNLAAVKLRISSATVITRWKYRPLTRARGQWYWDYEQSQKRRCPIEKTLSSSCLEAESLDHIQDGSKQCRRSYIRR